MTVRRADFTAGPRTPSAAPVLDQVAAVAAFLERLGIVFSLPRLRSSLVTHPDHPQTVGVLETLDAYGLDAAVERTTLDELALPALAHVRLGHAAGLVPIERGRTSGTIECWLGSDGWVELSREDFAQIWSGVVVEVEVLEGAGELAAAETPRTSMRTIAAIGIGIALVLLAALPHPAGPWSPFLVASLIGPGLALLVAPPLVAAHLGSTASLSRWCPTRGASSCAAVVQSRFGMVRGVPLADVALVYAVARLGLVAVAWISGDPAPFAAVLLALATAALPFAIASVVVQWRVLRQWCRLCLLIQAGLWLDAGGGWWLSPQPAAMPSLASVAAATALVALLVAAWVPLRRTLRAAVGSEALQDAMVRQLRTPVFVRAAMMVAEPLPPRVPETTVTFGEPDRGLRVTIVAKLRCAACAEAVLELDRFVAMHPDELYAEIVVLADEPSVGQVHATILAAAPDSSRARELLRRWYRDPHQDAAAWLGDTKVGPVVESPTLSALGTWVRDVPVLGTPLVAIAGRPLPLGSGFDAVRALVFDGGVNVAPEHSAPLARASG